MTSAPDSLQEMLRMLTVSFERHLEGVELDERVSGTASARALGIFYHWPADVARSVCQGWIGGVQAHSWRTKELPSSLVTGVSRVGLLYPTPDMAESRADELASWLEGSLLSSPNIRELDHGPDVHWGDAALWSYLGTYVSPHDGSESERVEFGWRRGRCVLHLLVWGDGHVSSEGLRLGGLLDVCAQGSPINPA